MRRTRRTLRTLGTAMLVVVCGSCVEILTPCYNEKYYNGVLVVGGTMEGLWQLQTIDGAPIPTAGYPIPGKNVRLFTGNLYFSLTDPYFSDDCKTLLRERGVVRANYVTSTGGGPLKHNSYSGRYTHDNEDNTTTLGAAGHTLPVTVSGNTMTARAEVEVFGLGVTYTLVFRRVVN